MKNYPYYLYTSIGFILLYLVISMISIALLARTNFENILSRNIDSAKQEATLLQALSEGPSNEGTKNQLRDRIQKSINSSDNQIIYYSIIDWSGKYVCYPNKNEIGKIPTEQDALQLGSQEELNGKVLFDFLMKNPNASSSSIILLSPIKESDWIIASHINSDRVLEDYSSYKNSLYSAFTLIGLIILLFIIASLRVISNYYQKLLVAKSSQFEDGVLSITKLNSSLENYQKSLEAFTTEQEGNQVRKQEIIEESGKVDLLEDTHKIKHRMLTYVRDEILPIATEDISHIYVENTITYIIRKDGKRSTSGESLDQIYSYLDKRFFFRINRQIIVAITAINTIIKYGNSKLKIQVRPASEIDIIIGKNKASAFKQWLDL